MYPQKPFSPVAATIVLPVRTSAQTNDVCETQAKDGQLYPIALINNILSPFLSDIFSDRSIISTAA